MSLLLDTALRTLSTQRYLAFRFGALLFVPLLALAIGALTAMDRFPPAMLLVAAAAPIGLVLAYRFDRFEYGILGIVVAAGLVNFFSLPAGGSRLVASLMVTMWLVGRWVLQMVRVNNPVPLKPSPVNRLIFMFIAVNVVSYVWGIAFRDPLVWVWPSFQFMQLAALTTNILLPLLPLLVFNKLAEFKWLHWLTWIMIGLGTIYLVVYFYFSPLLNYILVNGSGGLFPMWVVALAYSLVLFDEDLPLWKRGLLLLLVFGLVYRTFFLGRLWLSGWVPLGVVCLVITFLRSKKLFVLVLLLGLIYIGSNLDYYYQDVVVANEDEGGTERLDLWRMNLEHVANHPLLGMGPAGYAVYNMTYHPWDARSTHNNYFDILAQTGIIGSVIFLALFATFVRLGYRTCRVLAGQRTFEEAFASATLAGCAGALVAMMLGDWVLPFAYNGTIAAFDHASYTWIFMGGLVTLYHLVKAGETAPGQGEAV